MTGVNRTEARRMASRSATPWVGTYLCDPDVCDHAPSTRGPLDPPGNGSRWCWHESTARRLAQQGGPSANAAADLAAWNALGESRKDRAA